MGKIWFTYEVASALLCCGFAAQVCCRFQNVTFFSEPNCGAGGLQESVFSSYFGDRTPELNSMIPYARSAIIYGMWWYSVKDVRFGNTTFGWVYRPNDIYNRNCNQGTPWARSPSADFYSYSMLARVGPADLSVSSLNLFILQNFDGYPVAEIQTTSATFSEQISVGSLVYTGQTGWTLYSLPNFTGDVMTLNPTVDPYSSEQLRYLNRLPNLRIGSVRMGIYNESGTSDFLAEYSMSMSLSLDEEYGGGADSVTSWEKVGQVPRSDLTNVCRKFLYQLAWSRAGIFALLLLCAVTISALYCATSYTVRVRKNRKERTEIKHQKLINEF